MASFLSPFWEFLFDAFGIFGIGIAMGIVTFIIVIALLLIGVVVSLIKKIITPYRKTKPHKTTYTTSSYKPAQPSKPKSEPSETPKSTAPVKETERYKVPTLEDYLKRANDGDVFAQGCCGSIYADQKDMDKAIYWFKKASDQGQASSNYRLGMIYLEGIGTEVNTDLAEKYLTRASEDDHDSAQYQLAMLYSKKNERLCEEKGYTTPEQRTSDAEYNENKEKYKYWLKKAAANGNMDAEYILYL